MNKFYINLDFFGDDEISIYNHFFVFSIKCVINDENKLEKLILYASYEPHTQKKDVIIKLPTDKNEKAVANHIKKSIFYMNYIGDINNKLLFQNNIFRNKFEKYLNEHKIGSKYSDIFNSNLSLLVYEYAGISGDTYEDNDFYQNMSLDDKLFVCISILFGLRDLHLQGASHNDLKFDNIAINIDINNTILSAKIIDFDTILIPGFKDFIQDNILYPYNKGYTEGWCCQRIKSVLEKKEYDIKTLISTDKYDYDLYSFIRYAYAVIYDDRTTEKTIDTNNSKNTNIYNDFRNIQENTLFDDTTNCNHILDIFNDIFKKSCNCCKDCYNQNNFKEYISNGSCQLKNIVGSIEDIAEQISICLEIYKNKNLNETLNLLKSLRILTPDTTPTINKLKCQEDNNGCDEYSIEKIYR